MPSIDCAMNPTAVGNDPERAGRTGLAYLLIAILFFLVTFWKVGRENNETTGKQHRNLKPPQ